MIPKLIERFTAWKDNVENHTIGFVIALIQLERAKRSQRQLDLMQQDLLRDVAKKFRGA